MAQQKLLSTAKARDIISACARDHAPFDRMHTVRIQEPDRYRYELKICAGCKKAAYAEQVFADKLAAIRPADHTHRYFI